MLWNKKILIGSFGTLLLVFCSVFASSACYAINDLTVTFNQGSTLPSGGSLLFPDCDSACYSNYKYLIVDTDYNSFPADSASRPFYVFSRYDGYLHQINFNYYFDSIYDISYFYDIKFVGDWGVVNTTVTFTLTNTLPGSSCPEPPTATLDITQNGTYDVSDYSTANVNVPQVSETPYDSKLDKLINAVYVVAGTMLVIYFFYAIYRMFFKGVN